MKRHVREGRAMGVQYINADGTGWLQPVRYVRRIDGERLIKEFPYGSGIAGYVEAS